MQERKRTLIKTIESLKMKYSFLERQFFDLGFDVLDSVKSHAKALLTTHLTYFFSSDFIF